MKLTGEVGWGHSRRDVSAAAAALPETEEEPLDEEAEIGEATN